MLKTEVTSPMKILKIIVIVPLAVLQRDMAPQSTTPNHRIEVLESIVGQDHTRRILVRGTTRDEGAGIGIEIALLSVAVESTRNETRKRKRRSDTEAPQSTDRAMKRTNHSQTSLWVKLVKSDLYAPSDKTESRPSWKKVIPKTPPPSTSPPIRLQPVKI